MKTIGIIGGGASGLTAAIAAARCEDVHVILLEHKDKPGKKILSTEMEDVISQMKRWMQVITEANI